MSRYIPIGISLATALLAPVISAEPTTIPFDLHDNKIVLPIRINGSAPVPVMLDSGMVDGILINDPRLAESLGLEPTGRITVEGAGSGAPVRARVAYGLKLDVGGTILHWQPAVIMPRGSEYVRLSRCLPFSGVVGHSIFKRWIVEIDHDRRVLRLHEPDAWRHDGSGHVLPLSVEGKKPYVHGRVTLADDVSLPVKLAVDTGASGGLYLNHEADRRIRPPRSSVETTLGRGVLGKRRGHVGRVAALRLGDLRVERVVTGFPDARIRGLADDRHGLIGNDLLRRFRVVFDYGGGRLVLEPGTRHDEPFEYDMVGMQFDPGRGVDCALRVDEIVDGSPAKRAGVRLGDVLLSVDDTAAEELTASEIRELFRSGPGTEYRLRLRRGRETVAVVVRLDRLL